jgi:hypothetical protein
VILIGAKLLSFKYRHDLKLRGLLSQPTLDSKCLNDARTGRHSILHVVRSAYYSRIGVFINEYRAFSNRLHETFNSSWLMPVFLSKSSASLANYRCKHQRSCDSPYDRTNFLSSPVYLVSIPIVSHFWHEPIFDTLRSFKSAHC